MALSLSALDNVAFEKRWSSSIRLATGYAQGKYISCAKGISRLMSPSPDKLEPRMVFLQNKQTATMG